MLVSVKKARIGIIENIGELADGESMLNGFFDNGHKLSTLKDIETYANYYRSREDQEKMLREWHKEKTPAKTLRSDTREVLVRIMFENYGGANGDAVPTMLNILKQSCSTATDRGDVGIASQKLHRLRNSIAHMSSTTTGYFGSEILRSGFTPLRMMLLEAKILWKSGDHLSATRLAKLVVTKLQQQQQQQQQQDGEADGASFLAEALLTCGQWLAKSRTEGHSVVASKYLKPAVQGGRVG